MCGGDTTLITHLPGGIGRADHRIELESHGIGVAAVETARFLSMPNLLGQKVEPPVRSSAMASRTGPGLLSNSAIVATRKQPPETSGR